VRADLGVTVLPKDMAPDGLKVLGAEHAIYAAARGTRHWAAAAIRPADTCRLPSANVIDAHGR
jgi:hypothetical protein